MTTESENKTTGEGSANSVPPHPDDLLTFKNIASRVGKQAILPTRRDPIVCRTAREAQEIVDGYNTLARQPSKERFHPRFINLAAITDTAGTISTQCWCTSQDDIYDAERVLVKWCTPSEEKWHGKIIHATMFDHDTKELRQFTRDAGILKEVLS